MIDFEHLAGPYLSVQGRTVPEPRRCPDTYAGVIGAIAEAGSFTEHAPAEARPDGLPCVILILDSPHKAEFHGEPGPARGKPGQNIARFILAVPGLEDTGTAGLLLMHAVQFQCSLGLPTNQVRDGLFADVWDHGGRADFLARIDALYRPGDRVVNACTRGYAEDPAEHLRVKVQQALHSVPDIVALRRNHPSNWHYAANRNSEWTLDDRT